MNRENQISGMTLIELVIGMGLMGIILTALATTFSQNSRAAVQANVRAEAQQETLNAEQLITGRLREAFYVWPSGQTVELSQTAGAKNAPTYQNPYYNSGSTRYKTSTWLTGTDPILAMILPPVNPAVACTATATGAAAANNDGCYRFYAYYPVNRKVWTDGTSGSNDPGADDTNNNAWVLVQYNAYLVSTFNPASVATTIPSLDSSLTGSNASVIAYPTANAAILSEYISPTIADSTTTGMTTAYYTMFTTSNTNGTSPSATVPVNQVLINLATSRLIGNTLMRLPSATGTYSISVVLGNQGKIAGS